MKTATVKISWLDQWQTGDIEEVIDMLPDLLKINGHTRLIPASEELAGIIEQVLEQSKNQ